MSAKVGDRLEAGRWIGHHAGPVGNRLVLSVTECGDGFGLRYLMRQHITEWPKLGDFKFAIAHRFDFSVVTGGDIDLDLAPDLLADHLADLFVDRRQTGRGIIRLDAEAHGPAVRTVVGANWL
jgi:hypothetical protein